MPEAQIVEILPGQVISGIDVTMEPWWENHPPSLPGAGSLAATEGVDAADSAREERAAGTPNLMFIFGYRDPLHYRYVRFLPGATEIGQVGDLPGQPAVRTRKRAGILAGRWHQTRVDFHPDGLVRVYRGNVALAALRFAAAEPGRVGVGARGSQGVVDAFDVWGRTALN